ncbi:MAG: FkbM family methyltransferase [Desulfobacterales bacterium]|nr:FkbM family methyltransferase [Desulfobacterales bacterium]
MIKMLVNLLCCFVPLKRWRKRIRYDLADRKRRRRELLEFGFRIDDDIITTPQGVRMDISDKADRPLYLIKEVFVKSEYNLNIAKESVLIDIGMNRAAASLLFAANKNIKRVYSYEPFSPTFDKAKKNLNLNPKLSEKVIPHNCGLGKADVTLELPYIADATGGMSTTHDVCKGEKNIKKETVVVKDAAKEIIPILEENKDKHIIVKCDCEGAEFEIFERLNEKNILSCIDVVMMEYHFEKPDRLLNILTENGFAAQTKIGSRKSKTGYIYAVRMTGK